MIYKAQDKEKGYCVEIEVVDKKVCILVVKEEDIQCGGLAKISLDDWNKLINAMDSNNECNLRMMEA